MMSDEEYQEYLKEIHTLRCEVVKDVKERFTFPEVILPAIFFMKIEELDPMGLVHLRTLTSLYFIGKGDLSKNHL